MAGIGDFDVDALINNPQFQTGLGLMSAGRPNNPALLQAYQTLQAQRKFSEQQKLDQAHMAQEAAQTDVAKQQVGLLGQEVQQHAAQTELLRQQLQRKQAQWDFGMKFLQGIRPDLAGQLQPPVQVQPAPNAPPVQVPGPPNIPAATQAASLGKYGTPNLILDNLLKTESSGNPTAIGPPIPGSSERGLGGYQFLPSTIAMLKKEGITFNPFDIPQSRDAADYLLQKNLQANGGDWNKAIAAYGGFKAKDPSAYIQKVTAGFSGSPEAQAAASVQRTSAQAQIDQLSAQSANARRDQQAAGVMRFMLDDPAGLSEAAKSGMPDYKPMELGLQANNQEFNQRAKVQELQQGEQRIALERGAGERAATKQERDLSVQQAAADTNLKNLVQQNDFLRSAIDRVLKNPDLKYVTGRMGMVSPNALTLINPKLGNLAQDIEQITGSRVNSILQATRQASANGASGFGQFQQFEHDMLAAIDSLKRSRTTEEFKSNLADVNTKLDNLEHNLADAYKTTYKTDAPSAYPDLPAGSHYMGHSKSTGKPYYRLPDGSIKLQQ